ncbi:MAG: hypothetical protein K0A93_12065 [Desulfuromonadaceae bacterium]|nr:hypothetical protein [Desulfuromonadaceae bacterium]
MRKLLLSFWSLDGGEQGLGNAALLDQPLTAFFASRQCPGTTIRAAMDWAIEQARTKNPVISGFHSSLEQSVLKVLLTAKAPCVIVLARKFDQQRLSSDWLSGIHNGTVAVVSMEDTKRRLTAELAARRNDWIARRSGQIIIAPSAGGLLQQQSEQWGTSGLDVHLL